MMARSAHQRGAISELEAFQPVALFRGASSCFIAEAGALAGAPLVAVNFAVSAARARAKTARRESPAELKQAAAGWRASQREQRENDLRQMGLVIPLSHWLGHNNGPDILESLLFKAWCWRRAQRKALAPPDAETGRRWAGKAEVLGLTYTEYRLELLERGRHPTEEDAARIRAARPLPT
jgi:hypothetical protein